MPQARVRYVTDDGSFGSWHSRDRRDLLADPVWAAAFDYADKKFPRAGRQPAPQKPSEWIRSKAVDYSNGASQVAYTRRLTNAVIDYLDKLAAEAEAERPK